MVQFKRLLVNITMLVYTCFFSVLCTAIDSTSLPSLGSSAGSSMSSRDEQILGRQLLEQLYHYDAISSDQLVNDYISQLGKKLAYYAPVNTQHFNFFAIPDYSINAFAFFDGNVGVHYGAILAAENESEIAAIMAHEIAHVAQKHLIRNIEESKKIMPLSILGAIASVAVGAPELAMASMAGGQQAAINYTREYEKEADRVGITILANAGFNPQDMANIFYKMERESRYQDRPPEFLLSHPLYENRINDARSRADRYPYKQDFSSQAFQLVRARIRVSAVTNVKKFIYQLKQNIAEQKYNNLLEAKYTLALAYLANQQYNESEQTISPLLPQNKDNIYLQLLLADIYSGSNKHAKCLQVLQKIYTVYPDNAAIQLKLANALINNANYKQAEKVLLDYNQERESLEGYDLLVKTESLLNNNLETHLYKARWHILRGEMPQAEMQLAVALEVSKQGAYAKQEVGKLQQQIKQIKEDQKSI